MKKILLVLFFFLLPGSAYSWQKVVVEELFTEEPDRVDIRGVTLESGFRQAVSQEMDRILPGRISLERKSALMEHIQEHVDGLVQGYRQVSRRESGHAVTLEMEVNIDTDYLRTLLRKTGVYYTSDSSWPYELNTRGASPEDFYLLQELQLITGTVVDGNAATRLSLGKSADGLWTGNIDHDEISMSASGNDLGQVWFDLWEYFFSRPEIKAGFVEDLTLVTWGWSTTDSVMLFDKILETWDREVEFREIVSVDSDLYSLGASWSILSPSPELLLKRLDDYLSAREIRYSTERH